MYSAFPCTELRDIAYSYQVPVQDGYGTENTFTDIDWYNIKMDAHTDTQPSIRLTSFACTVPTFKYISRRGKQIAPSSGGRTRDILNEQYSIEPV